MRRTLLGILAALTISGHAIAGPIEDCDRLAGEPRVPMAKIAPEAAEACAAAIDLDPSPRLMHQYARALESLGQVPSAIRYYGWALEDGYPAAAMALERLGKTASTEVKPAVDAFATYVEAIEPGAEALAAAIARDFAFIPTGASLRAPEAVLSLRRGSGPDLARLLARLVVEADPEADTQFGLCGPGPKLSADLAAKLQAQVEPQPLSLLGAFAQAKEVSSLTGPGLEALQELSDLWSVALEEGRLEAEALAADLSAIADIRAQDEQALADVLFAQIHVVVEILKGAEKVVLDPLTGQSFDVAQCGSYKTSRALPEELVPQIHVILTAFEDSIDGSMVPREILNATLPFKPGMVLGFAESWGVTPPDAPLTARTQNFTPMLLSGETTLFGDPVVMPLAPSLPPDLAGAIQNRLSVLFAEEADGQKDGLAASEMPVTLRRIELEIRLPSLGAPKEVQTMVLVDRPNMAVALPDFGGLYFDFLQLSSFSPLDGSADVPAAILHGAPTDVSAAALTSRARMAGQTMGGFEMMRRSIFADLSAAQAPRPQGVGLLVTTWNFAVPEGPDNDFGLTLRQRMLRAPEPVRAGTTDPNVTAAFWAVASVLAERLSLQMALPGPEMLMPKNDAVAVWTGARRAGPARLVQGPEDIGAISASAADRVKGHLLAGHLLLMPTLTETPLLDKKLAWWIITPFGAIVEDQFADGGRNESAERTLLQEKLACKTIGPFARYQATLGRGIAAIALHVQLVAAVYGVQAPTIVELVVAVVEARTKAEETAAAVEAGASAGCGGAGPGPGP